jgi:cytoskeletal protein RodZ
VNEIRFGEYLRLERQARRVSLEQVEARSKIGQARLEALERNDWSRLPPDRFYREHLIRAYAAAIGLDSRKAIEGFRRDFPVDEPVPAAPASSSHARGWVALSGISVAVLVAVLTVLAGVDRQPAASQPAAASDEATGTAGHVEDMQPRVEPVSVPALETPPPSTQALEEPPPWQVETASPAAEDIEQAGGIEGELTLTSTPPGARVIVNGIYRGETPVRVEFLPVDSYTIRFIEDGYRSEQRNVVMTPSRRRIEVTATLQPESGALQ